MFVVHFPLLLNLLFIPLPHSPSFLHFPIHLLHFSSSVSGSQPGVYVPHERISRGPQGFYLWVYAHKMNPCGPRFTPMEEEDIHTTVTTNP